MSQAEDQWQQLQRQLCQHSQPSSVLVTSEHNGGDYIGGTVGIMGGYSFTASTAAEPAPQKRPTETREKELSGSEALGVFRAFWGGGGSTDPMAMAEEYEGNGVFDNIEDLVSCWRSVGHHSTISITVADYGSGHPTTYGKPRDRPGTTS